MKKIALIIFLVSNIICYSETVYIGMTFEGNSIKVDYGTSKKAETIKDDNGKDLKFYSLIGALNYMSSKGWKLIGSNSSNVSTTTHGSVVGIYSYSSSSSNSKETYILCREKSAEDLEKVVENSFKK